MEKIEFNNACYEVLEILKYIKDEDLKKIPKEEIEMLKNNANYKHDFVYNPKKTIKEQNVSKLAKGIIAVFFEKYTASETQKEKIRKKRAEDLKLINQEKERKYSTNVFEKINESSKINDEKSLEEQKNENTQLIVKREDKWYKKLIKSIKNFFYIKRN